LIAQYSEKFKAHGVISSQVLLTTEDVVRRSHYANAQQTLTKLLSLGVVPVINEMTLSVHKKSALAITIAWLLSLLS
jgi:glutamate 5-kinase